MFQNFWLIAAGSLLLGGLFALGGCASRPSGEHASIDVPPAVLAGGESIYFGTVFPLDADTKEPTFVYERRVAREGDRFLSTHITRTPSGRVELAETATHDADYALRSYVLHGNQLGVHGTIDVAEGEVRFHRVDASGVRDEVEAQDGVVVVGPTLVGYIGAHLPALRAGEVFPVRLALLDRLETLGFDLAIAESAPGETKVRMTPSSFFVRLAVDPIDYTFGPDGKLARLEGRVPPKHFVGGRYRDFDARVEYAFVAPEYR
ncbi:MAG: hypothetical protein JNK04_21515 [Myxococcales bacterium]|nr:hypothetical protein [Myxococcales bacterium]